MEKRVGWRLSTDGKGGVVSHLENMERSSTSGKGKHARLERTAKGLAADRLSRAQSAQLVRDLLPFIRTPLHTSSLQWPVATVSQ